MKTLCPTVDMPVSASSATTADLVTTLLTDGPIGCAFSAYRQAVRALPGDDSVVSTFRAIGWLPPSGPIPPPIFYVVRPGRYSAYKESSVLDALAGLLASAGITSRQAVSDVLYALLDRTRIDNNLYSASPLGVPGVADAFRLVLHALDLSVPELADYDGRYFDFRSGSQHIYVASPYIEQWVERFAVSDGRSADRVWDALFRYIESTRG